MALNRNSSTNRARSGRYSTRVGKSARGHATTNASTLVTSCTAIQMKNSSPLRRTRSPISDGSKRSGTFPQAFHHDHPASAAAPARSPATNLQYPQPAQASATDTTATASPRQISGATSDPIASSRSKNARGTTASPSSSTHTANTRNTIGSCGVCGANAPTQGAATINSNVNSAPLTVTNASTVPYGFRGSRTSW